jgi:hypothetical protein
MPCEPPFIFSWGNINQQILGKDMGEKKLEYKKISEEKMSLICGVLIHLQAIPLRMNR